jgi:hypothetical protein
MRTRSLQRLRGITFRLLAGCLIVLCTVVSAGLAQDQAEKATGELKIEGTHIARLVLRGDDNHTEDWTDLSGSINLPVGTYRVQRLELRDNCMCQPQSLTELGQITVSEDKPAGLKAGGPLRQTIDVRRQGRVLVLSYRLLGIGGETYATSRLSDRRPTFTVYKGDKALASGAFEYG